MDGRPVVSFVIAVHNGSAFVETAVMSAAAQTHSRLEIIVVDDGSTDESATIVERLAGRDDRIRLIRIEHAGPQSARNVGVAAVRGDFVAHLDHDDIASSVRVSTQLAWMASKGIDVCGSCTRVFGDHSYTGWVPETHDDILRESVFRCAMVHPTTLLPASIAKSHPFNPRDRCGGAELPIRLALNHGYRLGNVPQVLVKYRHHAAQRCRVEARAIGAHRRLIKRRVFRALFPDATAADEAAVLSISDGVRTTGRAGLELAGPWMARLAVTDNPTLRQLMLDRWTDASAGLDGSRLGKAAPHPSLQ